MLESIQNAVARVAQCKTKDRKLSVVREYLQGKASTESKEGKELLHRRALFVSELSKRGLWP